MSFSHTYQETSLKYFQSQDGRAITPDEDNETAVSRSLQVFGQVISSLASKNKEVDCVGQMDMEIPYKESVRII